MYCGVFRVVARVDAMVDARVDAKTDLKAYKNGWIETCILKPPC